AGDFAVAADPGVLLDLDKRADLGVIANFAAVQVDELREFDVLAQLDVGSNANVVAHNWTGFPLSLSDCPAASRSRTTRRPAAPSLNGFSFFSMQSRKYLASTFNASL